MFFSFQMRHVRVFVVAILLSLSFPLDIWPTTSVSQKGQHVIYAVYINNVRCCNPIDNIRQEIWQHISKSLGFWHML